MHSALLVPSKIFMFFIICLLTSSFLLLLATCAMICVRVSVILADGTGYAPLKGVWMVMLVLGWWASKRFLNNGVLLVWPVCCLCGPVAAVPNSGGGVTVGWYPVGMWLFVGLLVWLWCFLHALVSWFAVLQCVQKTLFLTVYPHMTLFSTFETCGALSIV